MIFRTAAALTGVLWVVAANAGNPADSLKPLLLLSKSDTDKIWLLRDMACYLRAEQPDAALN